MAAGLVAVPRSCWWLVAACAGVAGCSHGQPATPVPAAPTVTVAYPDHREIVDYRDYTGRTAAVESVDVQAQVSGYLDKINFKDGDEVKKGQVLYVIDQRPYKAALDQAKAQLGVQQASLVYNQAVYDRDVRLGRGSVSTEELQKDLSSRNTSQAAVAAARAAVEQAELNLKFTKIESPITGRLSRTLITRGNLVVANQSLLTNIVTQDPMYVYVDVDEPTALHVQELIRQGKFTSLRQKGARVPVFIRLATERDYGHEGRLDFVNNQLSTTTATLQLRGTFDNPKPSVGYRVLSPGLFVGVRLTVSPRYQAVLVKQAAVGSDLDVRYVYVLDNDDRVARRNVELGSDHDDQVAIIKGLKPAERVIIDGLQQVRPGMIVKPKLVKMTSPAKDVLPETPPDVNRVPTSGQ